ncbi:hypothetical protein EDD21DRAFT_375276 [Dissophora ornata]|nr:hypothetical protein EDD21DRAFT_375276 [Dissophora ornata]
MNSNPLPPGWISQYAPDNQQYFFVDTTTGRSQWQDPRISAPPNYSAPPGPPNQSSNPQSAQGATAGATAQGASCCAHSSPCCAHSNPATSAAPVTATAPQDSRSSGKSGMGTGTAVAMGMVGGAVLANQRRRRQVVPVVVARPLGRRF